MATAIVFPGQGSQTPDMRELVAEWRPDLLAAVPEIVGTDPFAQVAASTRFAQPAIYCASLAGVERLNATGQTADAVAGHSLGEITALAAAGAIDPLDGLKLVALRGAAMADAGRRGAGGMLAVLGGDLESIESEAARATVTVANDNCPGQVVLAASRAALMVVADRLRATGARTVMLDVAGAFHSPFMASAVGPFAEALAGIEIGAPRVPVWSSSQARPFGDAADIRTHLAAALVRPVRWRQTVLAMHESGVERFVEAGPGAVLTKLARRTLKALAHA